MDQMAVPSGFPLNNGSPTREILQWHLNITTFHFIVFLSCISDFFCYYYWTKLINCVSLSGMFNTPNDGCSFSLWIGFDDIGMEIANVDNCYRNSCHLGSFMQLV